MTMIEEILEALAPHAFEAVMSLVWLVLTYLAFLVRRWTGVVVEEKHLRVLHSAIRTGVTVALDRGLRGEAVAAAVREYVRQSAPDAIKALGPSFDVLETLIAAKIAEAAK